MSKAREIARHLLQIKAIKLSPQAPFTWASGIESPIYCDNRMILSFPKVRNDVKSALAASAGNFAAFDVVAGVATAGIAHGMLLADALGKPFIYVRDKAKGHGRQNRIEGALPTGKRVLVVEDLISTGGSSLRAVEALREADAEVIGCLAIFTYGFERAAKAFEEAEVPLRTLSNYEIMSEEALESGYITRADLDTLRNFRERVGA